MVRHNSRCFSMSFETFHKGKERENMYTSRRDCMHKCRGMVCINAASLGCGPQSASIIDSSWRGTPLTCRSRNDLRLFGVFTIMALDLSSSRAQIRIKCRIDQALELYVNLLDTVGLPVDFYIVHVRIEHIELRFTSSIQLR